MKLHLIGGKQPAPEELSMLESFGSEVYLPAFPDPDEREPFTEILGRIGGGNGILSSYAVIATDAQGAVLGGCIYDWYPSCSSAELIYIAIADGRRRSGLGAQLLCEGTELFASGIRKTYGGLKRLYFETENPFIPSEDERMDKVGRIAFFARNGAMRVPIDYAQPPLASGLGWARNLFLCTLPRFSDDGGDSIPAGELKTFLTSFYEGLGVQAGDEELVRMLDSIDEIAGTAGSIDCHALIEQPEFNVRSISICWHFLLGGNSVPAGGGSATALPDKYFNSFECDLLNAGYQDSDKRPLRTGHIALLRNVKLRLPRFYSYLSEGRECCRLTQNAELSMRVSVNCTESTNGGYRVAHMILSPEESTTEFLNELDCIKLIGPFGSPQEDYAPLGGKRFSFEYGGRELSPEELVCTMLSAEGCTFLRNGITRVDMSELLHEAACVCPSLSEFRQHCTEDNSAYGRFNKLLCGLILGIFDFNRMDSSEISDTIAPMMYFSDAASVLCRGNLLRMEWGQEMPRHILMSPYLIIPSAVLCINDAVLEKNLSRLDGEPAGRGLYRQYIELSARIREVLDSMSSEYLVSIFHYRSEQEILAAGTQQRGLDRRKRQLETEIESNKLKLEELKSKEQLGPEYITNGLLAVLALMQVMTAFMGSRWFGPLTAALILAVAAFFYYQLRHKRKM